MSSGDAKPQSEQERLDQDEDRLHNWKRWGPYLAERQWGTVREDYSESGDCWTYFPHDQARSRAYRWGEDGLLGITDRQCRLCLGVALWNGQDPILKERLFGLSGNEGNHGEDVKECYYYLDSTPTHSYLKALYKYPQRAFPYERLVEENRTRGRRTGEFELTDTDAFDDDRYFDVLAEYAKHTPEDILARFTITNRGPEEATLDFLPTLWFRNTWCWGRSGEGYWQKPLIRHAGDCSVAAPELIFTENETNTGRLFNTPNSSPYVKDGFHEAVVNGHREAVNPEGSGTKCAAWYKLKIPAHGKVVVRLRLFAEAEKPKHAFGADFDRVFERRLAEANEFYAVRTDALSDDEALIVRQANAGLLWSKQFYQYVVRDWVEGDPAHPAPPESRKEGRNKEWGHLYNRDVISMPDKWEYPWYAAWDLAFHMIPFAALDPRFAKEQLVLMLREWYMHPNGQIPAYEFQFGDVNPPVHAWAAWRIYKITGPRGHRDRTFLARVFNKLLMNFTWWVNRKDAEGRNLFAGGFLGLDNVGVFDRSKPLPTGGHLNQADGTAWMAFYCITMLEMALELAKDDPAYEDLASKFFEHFVAIADAMNQLGGSGLWSEDDGFYYDQLTVDGERIPLRVRSMVGLIPIIAAGVLESTEMHKLRGFTKRMNWFLENRKDLAKNISYMEVRDASGSLEGHRLLAIPTRERLAQVLRYMLDENEFLSPYGIRSLSKIHATNPYVFVAGDVEHRVDYEPGESSTGLFGGNSNWRGPVWFPVNYLLIESLEIYHHFYGDQFKVECPTGSGHFMNLKQVADELALRLSRLFIPDASGARPSHGGDPRYASDPAWRDLVLFYEYFHGDTGQGLGASHQTGWTALVARLIQSMGGTD
jgi:hypothetical protein